jgi:hypothetical protein
MFTTDPEQLFDVEYLKKCFTVPGLYTPGSCVVRDFGSRDQSGNQQRVDFTEHCFWKGLINGQRQRRDHFRSTRVSIISI